MLVYFVNHSTAPINLGGAERSMMALVEDWYASDPEFEAVFITKAPRGKFVDALEERGWAYRSFRYRGWTIPNDTPPQSEITFFANDDYRSTLEIIEMMEQRRPDLVVTNTLVAPWAAFAAAVVGVPHAWFIREFGDLDHGLAFQIGRENTFQDIALMSQAVFTNSIALRDHIGAYIDVSDVQVVYPRIDAAAQKVRATEPPAIRPFGDGIDLAVTVVGRLADSKGQWRVIEALGILRERGLRVGLCLVGGQERPDYDVSLTRRAARLGVGDQVVITGEQANPFPFIAAADVCVTPSGIEAFGRTTLEYMLAGKAVVASELGGSAELVSDGTTGFLFHPDDTTALADALERYARDPELRTAYATAAESRARELIDHEFSNANAIERLKRTASAEPYRLPNIARYWFSLPGHYFATAGRGPRITLSFIRTRLRGRLGAVVKRPLAALRRRIAR
ncbi:glycosyltransferase family 4 protein [Leifsonia sp. NPDC058248]|uniref:glycosyltransferase family 4 protein n=1 Tax=Leifsonia sp. NPDC058248 TaxID=3346402 RepID=UPI0036DBD3AC